MENEKRILKCGRCGSDLSKITTNGNYLGFSFPVELDGCSNCGIIYVSEELVDTRVAQLETTLEGK